MIKVGRPKHKTGNFAQRYPPAKTVFSGTSSYYLDAGFDNLFDLDMDCLIVLLNIKFTLSKETLLHTMF
jgi:hypothetical protein